MGVYFKSIRSGSSGNCLMLWTPATRVLVDCGFRSQKQCRAVLAREAGDLAGITAVVVTHPHADHINYPSLRVLESEGIPVRIHEGMAQQLKKRHFQGRSFEGLRLRAFSDGWFRIGEFVFHPIPLEHYPGCSNFGFSVRCSGSEKNLRIVIMTDFFNWKNQVANFANADFIFVEANHDADLLRKKPNPNSSFHMLNKKTGRLLRRAREASEFAPVTVMLGHLSEERNTGELALNTVRGAFKKTGLDFELLVASRRQSSRTVQLAR